MCFSGRLAANDELLHEAEQASRSTGRDRANRLRTYHSARSHHLATLLALFTGMRWAEIRGLPWSCAHVRERRIEVRWSRARDYATLEPPKSGRPREVDFAVSFQFFGCA